jgi:hypothetical protein
MASKEDQAAPKSGEMEIVVDAALEMRLMGASL